MAVKDTLLKSNLSIKKIQKSVSSFNEGISKARQSTTRLQSNLIERNRIKRKALQFEASNFHARRQAVQRKNAEEVAEVSSISGAKRFAGNLGSVVAKSSKGFFGRLVDVIGVLLVGWLINNLPTIIKGIQGLIARIQKFVGMISGFVTTIQRFFGTIISMFEWTWNTVRGKNKEFAKAETKVRAANIKAAESLGMIDKEISNAKQLSDGFSLDGSESQASVQQPAINTNQENLPTQEDVTSENPPPEEEKKEEPKKGWGENIGGWVGGITGGILGGVTGFFADSPFSPAADIALSTAGWFGGEKIGSGIGKWFDTTFGGKKDETTQTTQTVEPQTPLVNISGMMGGGNNMATGDDLDAVNQEREMFDQEPLTNEKENRSWWNRSLGAVDWMTGGRTDLDGRGNTPDQVQPQVQPNPIQPSITSSSITPERRGRVIYVQQPSPSTPSSGGGGGGGGTSMRIISVNSSRELARRITLNNLQYT